MMIPVILSELLLTLRISERTEIELGNIKNELSLALDAGSLSVWTYDVSQKKFSSFYHDTG